MADQRRGPDPSLTGARLIVDLGALKSNYRALRNEARSSRVAAVVKADAYGLGATRVAPALFEAGCRDFFVAQIGEALALKPHLPGAAIYVLNGLQPGAEASCAASGVVPVLNSLEQARRWAQTACASGVRLPAALQIDTGMSRLGLESCELGQLQSEWFAPVAVQLVLSHLACADDPEDGVNAAQLGAFAKLAQQVSPAPLSLANSDAIFLSSDYHHGLVRPGIALYGVTPKACVSADIRRVVRLDARVVQVRSVGAGVGIGYGHSYRAQSPAKVATISVGYADGWPTQLGNKGAAYRGGVRLPIIGRISMDTITLDVSALPDGALKLGDYVELLGPHQSVEQVAEDAGTISYEILTRLGSRYERLYVDGEAGCAASRPAVAR